jgi:hypothetical protein
MKISYPHLFIAKERVEHFAHSVPHRIAGFWLPPSLICAHFFLAQRRFDSSVSYISSGRANQLQGITVTADLS